MKYIKLDFLPFKIHKKFNIAQKEINNMDNIQLFKKYDARLNLYRNWFNKTQALFLFNKLDNFEEINDLLISYYGKPQYISNTNSNAWKIEDIYIFHNIEINRLDKEIHTLSISLLPPTGLLDYNTYCYINDITNNIQNEFNFIETKILTKTSIHDVTLWFESLSYLYLINIDKKFIYIQIHGRAAYNFIQKEQKFKYNEIKDINELLVKYFKEKIIFDSSLYKKEN